MTLAATPLDLPIDETKAVYGLFNNDRKKFSGGGGIVAGTPPSISIDSKAIFRKLANEWQHDTAHLSQISSRLQHPAYRKILNMGPSAVPLILERMENEPDHWFYALYTLTGENPVPRDFTGTIDEAINIWIDWGHDKYAR